MRNLQLPGRSPVLAPNGMVSTSQPLSTAAGLHVLREGGNLVSAAVSEPRPFPSGKAVESALVADDLFPGSFVQVVGVGEQDLCTDFGQVSCGDPANGTEGGHRHEGRRGDGTMRCLENAGAGIPILVLDLQGDRRFLHGVSRNCGSQRISMASP